MKTPVLFLLIAWAAAVFGEGENAVSTPDTDASVSPILKIPIQANGIQTALELYANEQPEVVVREFCVKHKIDLSNVQTLVQELEKRLPPVIVSLPLNLGGGSTINLKLYEGWNIREAVEAFVLKHGLGQKEFDLILENLQQSMTLVTLNIRGSDGNLLEPPLKLMNGQSPDIVVLDYCAQHNLDITVYAHQISEEIRKQGPPEITRVYGPARRVLFLVPFQVDEGQTLRSAFYENDVPHEFSAKLCTQFKSGEGCYERILGFVTAKLSEVTNVSPQKANDDARAAQPITPTLPGEGAGTAPTEAGVVEEASPESTQTMEETPLPEHADPVEQADPSSGSKVSETETTKEAPLSEQADPSEPADQVDPSSDPKVSENGRTEEAPLSEEADPVGQADSSDPKVSGESVQKNSAEKASQPGDKADEYSSKSPIDSLRDTLRPAFESVVASLPPDSLPTNDPLIVLVPICAIFGIVFSFIGGSSKKPAATATEAKKKNTNSDDVNNVAPTKKTKASKKNVRSKTPKTPKD